ncbi:MAG: AhpC/TSA family protein [Cyanobacteria bacterium]|nr:AhpC/TSA family protein [Cyanobacteriota bacterium]
MTTTVKASQLTQELNETRQKFRTEIIPPHILAIMDNDTKALKDSGIEKTALNVGNTAPDFILMDAQGQSVRLYSLLEKGPVVLNFYRGGWCPYCNLALRGLQRELGNIQQLGAQLVAITPELPDSSLTTQEKNELQFQILSDVGNSVAGKFGIAFDLSPELLDVYNNVFNNQLTLVNGEAGAKSLPVPATFVIDQQKVIRYAFVDADYTLRFDPQAMLEALKKV